MFGNLKDMDWSDFGKVIIALLVSAAGWSVNNQATVITWAAVIVVWVLNMLFKWRDIQLGRRVLTLILFVVALVLAVLFTPVTLPVFPVFAGDPGVYVDALLAYLAVLMQLASGIVAAATGLYNVLLKDVLAKLWYAPAEIVQELVPDERVNQALR